MTQPESKIIEEIVREVLARLQSARQGDAAPDPPDVAPDAGDSSVDTPAQRARNGDLVLSARVVSLSEVEERLAGVRRLVVPPGAVVTPSVRDELRRRNVAVVYDRPVVAGSAGGLRVMMAVLGSRFDPAPLQGTLVGEGVRVRVERAECLIAATDALARHLVRPDAAGLLISTHPAAALCLANRHGGVRAVQGIDPGRLAADAASVGANVLVLDPRSTGPFQLKQMAVGFCRQGPHECPEDLRERLG